MSAFAYGTLFTAGCVERTGTEINNRSGHYKPFGGFAGAAAVKAFTEAGYDAEGKYVEYEFP